MVSYELLVKSGAFYAYVLAPQNKGIPILEIPSCFGLVKLCICQNVIFLKFETYECHILEIINI